jgi:hypothetical protein
LAIRGDQLLAERYAKFRRIGAFGASKNGQGQ